MFFKLMGIGDTGQNGLAVQKPVDQEPEAEQESVTTQSQLMEEKTVRDQVKNQEFVTTLLLVHLRYNFHYVIYDYKEKEKEGISFHFSHRS